MSISLKNISKVYNDGEYELKALNNVTIDIDENEYVRFLSKKTLVFVEKRRRGILA